MPIDVFILIFKLFETKTMLITFEVHTTKKRQYQENLLFGMWLKVNSFVTNVFFDVNQIHIVGWKYCLFRVVCLNINLWYGDVHNMYFVMTLLLNEHYTQSHPYQSVYIVFAFICICYITQRLSCYYIDVGHCF